MLKRDAKAREFRLLHCRFNIRPRKETNFR